MKLSYITISDATDIRSWSGLDRSIWEALAAQGAEIELVGSLSHFPSVARKLRKLWGQHIEGKSLNYLWDVDTAKGFAQDAAARIAKMGIDAILSPNPIPLAYLERNDPMFLWTDATFSALLNFYPEFSQNNLCRASVQSGLAIDRAALDRCTLAIFSSDWAAQAAMKHYDLTEDKVKVVPFGANVDDSPDKDQVKAIIEQRSRQCLHLLFIGVDWERKGGATALAAAQAIHDLWH